MSIVAQRRTEPLGIPARILVAGSDLLAGALASALKAYGFATRHIVPREPEIERGIEWRPNLVIVDVRSPRRHLGICAYRRVASSGPEGVRHRRGGRR